MNLEARKVSRVLAPTAERARRVRLLYGRITLGEAIPRRAILDAHSGLREAADGALGSLGAGTDSVGEPARPILAPLCDCARPVGATDEDGQRVCAACGRGCL